MFGNTPRNNRHILFIIFDPIIQQPLIDKISMPMPRRRPGPNIGPKFIWRGNGMSPPLDGIKDNSSVERFAFVLIYDMGNLFIVILGVWG